MGLGKMKNRISIIEKITTTDSEGFKVQTENVVASIRAYREGRHGSEIWANRSTFSDSTELFRFRNIPNTTITKEMIIQDGEEKFEITSIENVRGRKMYLEVLCREVKPSG